MSDIDLQKLTDVAREAARNASAYLVQEWEAWCGGSDIGIDTKTSATDMVTRVDGEAQKIVIETIQKHFPDHRFIGEEDGAEDIGDPNSPYEWIIDPLDGTLNFIHKRENFGVVVAVQKDEEIIAGCMEMPLLNQHFHGARGAGAFYNDKPVELRNTQGMTDAVLNCNTMRRATKGEDGIFRATMPYCASIENTGCAVQELGEVLRGKTDGVFFLGIRIWDIATGFLLIEEAGGKATYEWLEEGNNRSGLRCAASTAPIYDELWEWVQTKM